LRIRERITSSGLRHLRFQLALGIGQAGSLLEELLFEFRLLLGVRLVGELPYLTLTIVRWVEEVLQAHLPMRRAASHSNQVILYIYTVFEVLGGDPSNPAADALAVAVRTS